MLRIVVDTDSATEEVLSFKCCTFVDQNIEIILHNDGEKPVTVESFCELSCGDYAERIDYLYPQGARTIAAGLAEAFYLRFDENRLKKFDLITFTDSEGNKHSAPIFKESTGQ